jgi:uridylate kinase
MAKNGIDGVYDSDPRKNPNAVKYRKLTHQEVLKQELAVMDSTAAALCNDNDIDIYVFDMNVEGNIKRAILGEPIGTIITKNHQEG